MRINVNLKYDVRDSGWHRRGMFGSAVVRNKQAKKRKQFKRLGKVVVALWLVALSILVVPAMPYFWYRFFPDTTEAIADSLGVTADVAKSDFGEMVYEEPKYVPKFDANLPKENLLIINKIGFYSQIGEAPIEDVESVLRNGPWRVPNLGDPGNDGSPMVIASHRFGYIHWSNQYRRENSFYNLPKVENGDQIEIVWNQRKYVYEVYEGYTDTVIRDANADLILYTCEVLNSPRRIVRLARQVIPEETPRNVEGFDKLLTTNGVK